MGCWSCCPKARGALAPVIGDLAKPNALSHLVSGLDFQRVQLWFPKVTLDSGVMQLVPSLRQLGTSLLFGAILFASTVTTPPAR